MGEVLADPSVPVYIPEGEKHADELRSGIARDHQ